MQLTLTNAIVETTLGSTIKRRRRIFPWGTEPVVLERERDIWNQAYRALSEKVSEEGVLFNASTAVLTVGKKTVQMADPTMTPSVYQLMIASFQEINNKFVSHGWSEAGYCEEPVGGEPPQCHTDERLPILGGRQDYRGLLT